MLGPRDIALLAAVGRGRVSVHPQPRVVIISTGSELVEPGMPLTPGLVADSNGVTIAAAVQEAGAIAYRVGPLPDDAAALLATLEDQLVRADLVVTTGGVSAGAYDTVKAVLSRLGTVEFTTVAMQPGMPQGHGVMGPEETPIFTLPGNPVSAYVSFEVFVRPVIRRMLGHERIYRPVVRAVLAEPLVSPRGQAAVRARPPRGRGRALRRAPGRRPGVAHARGAGQGQRPRRHPRGRHRGQGRDRGGRAPTRRGLIAMSDKGFTHLDSSGAARMVDVSAKEVSVRTATATGRVLVSAEVVGLLRGGGVPKGDAIAVARIAGIQAAKRTPDLVPLCHPIAIHGVTVDLEVLDDAVAITAVVRTADRTGVEMEALTCVAVAGLALIDMVKAVDPARHDHRRARRGEDRRQDRSVATGRERLMRALVVAISTRAAAGVYADRTGPVIVEALAGLGFDVDGPTVVPDGPRSRASCRPRSTTTTTSSSPPGAPGCRPTT